MRQTDRYIRHGTTTLFAALDVATGRVIGKCFRRHRSKEFIRFLNEVDSQVPDHLDVHLVLDNRSTLALEKDIRAFLQHHNEDPTPYVWTKIADEILHSLARYCEDIAGE